MSKHEELNIGVLYLGPLGAEVAITKTEPADVIETSSETFKSVIVRTGDVIKTTIAIGLAGLKSSGTGRDVIGDTGISYIARITTRVNGAIYKGQVSCAEVPATGDDDIDLYDSSDADGVYDEDANALANASLLLDSNGAYAIGTVKQLTALPTADYYLYLANGDTTGGTYSAGKIIIELWGVAA
jgi:hypothetical protein